MARIQIEDLPNIKNMTQEEQEQILGAGQRSFKPTFDALEAREMMDAALGAVLPGLTGLANVDAPASHVREMGSSAGNVVDYAALDNIATTMARGAAPQAAGVQTVLTTAKQDAEFVKNEVARLIEQKLIPQLPSLASAKLSGREATVLSENSIRLDFKIKYDGWNWGAVGGRSTYVGTMSIHATSTWVGSVKVYKLGSQSLHNFEHSPQMKWETVGHAMDSMVANNRIQTNNTFDARKFADGVAKRAEALGRNIEQKGVGSYSVHHVEAIDGGIRVHVSAGTHPGYNYQVYGLILEFKYDTADIRSGSLRLTNVQSGAWYGGHGWDTHAIYTQPGLEHAMRRDGDRWSVGG